MTVHMDGEFNDESLQFLKEEKTDDAIYSIYLKKVSYNSTLSDRSVHESVKNSPDDSSNSTFYADLLDDQLGKAHLLWRLEEVRVIRYATVEHLIESLASDSGELDSSYVNTFLATYRAFTSADVVLSHLFNCYKTSSSNSKLTEVKKEGRKRSIKTVLSMWLDIYPEDFHEAPDYPSLCSLRTFARQYMPDNDLYQKCRDKIISFRKADEQSACLSADDISLDFNVSTLSISSYSSTVSSNSGPNQSRSLLETVSSKTFAEQLTCVDAELFKKLVVHQCLGSIWSRRNDGKQQADKVASVYATINQFNAVLLYVVATVLQPKLSLAERAGVIERWISIAQELRILKNFSSLKAVVSGLQSISVYRLRRTWMLVNRSKNQQFTELAQIFSDDDNQRISREVLYREGTAKFANPDTVALVSENHRIRQNSCLQSIWPRRMSSMENSSNDVKTVQGTVPYLGTFLTDLMMIDSALKDFAEDNNKLINFDKRRKEFEILTQIKLWQSAAGLYRIVRNPEFQRRFSEQKVYDESESYVISCEIETDVPSFTLPRRTARRRRRDSSIGIFQQRASPGDSDDVSRGCWPSSFSDSQSLHSYQDGLLSVRSRSLLRHSSSASILSAKFSKKSANRETGQQVSDESVVARVYMWTTDSDKSSHYKSILLNNSDRTPAVIQKALDKYDVSESVDHFCLYHLQSARCEFQMPVDANVFYAVNIHSQPIEFIVRRRRNSALQKLFRK